MIILPENLTVLLKSSLFLWNSSTCKDGSNPFFFAAVSRIAWRDIFGLVGTFTLCPLGHKTVMFDIFSLSENIKFHKSSNLILIMNKMFVTFIFHLLFNCFCIFRLFSLNIGSEYSVRFSNKLSVNFSVVTDVIQHIL